MSFSKNKKTLTIIVVVAVAVFVVYFWKLSFQKIAPPVDTLPVSTGTAEQNTDASIRDGRYVNPNYAFSFVLPVGFTTTSLDDTDEGGEAVTTVLIEDASKKRGVQIVISMWDEPAEELTHERVKRDIPGMRITDSATRTISSIGNVIEFGSDNEAFGGKSHEVWFVAHGNLYQVSTNEGNTAIVSDILSTWNFQ